MQHLRPSTGRAITRLRCAAAGLIATCQIIGAETALAADGRPRVAPAQGAAAAAPGGVVAPPDRAPLGKLIKRLRLLTHNVYAVDEDSCDQRARGFGLQLARAGSSGRQPYDIVGLQEYYENHFFDAGTVCDDSTLLQAARSTGMYRNSSNTSLFRPRFDGRHNGGVGVLTLHRIRTDLDWRWGNDQQGLFEAVEGFMFARIEIPGKDLAIDTYVVHLNSGRDNVAGRQRQLRQLAARIAQFSKASGNPVIVMGDFNIGGPQPRTNPPGNPGYQDIVRILRSPSDLWLNAHPQTVPTAGYTSGCDTQYRPACLGKERIDYIFHVTDPALTNSPYQLVVRNVSRVRWAEPPKAGAKDRHFVSDHFGVDATIEIRIRSP
ncbi:endonuclease/exonuclease/phosphatase family protein [Mesorhizobium sp. M1233]|uniref:endonuclease/exonuclease/phosphatase family protein n=1 Tax=Mesorhizobium sp. M1233 TaxID=2957072 RepID=UPI003336B7E4